MLTASAPEGTLVIGYGNTLRGDDGAGPRVAEAVSASEGPFLSVIAAHQLTPEMAYDVASAECVIFVDASADTEQTAVLVRSVEADGLPFQGAHSSSPEGLLTMARDAFERTPTAWLVTIPARNFEIGKEFSEVTQRALDQAIQVVLRLVGEAGCTKSD